MYKDHLRNLPAAAECLVRGGLFNEAIGIYKDLNQAEKVGDLYTVLKHEENAAIYYEKYIAVQLEASDYMDAARVIRDKRKQNERAKETLLKGWDDSYQPEPCLRAYFDIVLKEGGENTDKDIKEVYTNHTPKNRRLPFLNVLEYVSRKKEDKELR